MSAALVPCPSCNRHVFLDACACPFCAAKLRVCEASRAPTPNARLSRAARIAAGAALASVAACGGSKTIMPPYGISPRVDASTDAGGADGAGGEGGQGGVTGKLDAGADVTSPSDAATDRSVTPLYGAAAPVPGRPVR